MALRHLLAGRPAVEGQFMHPRADLLLEAADPLHEKFVQVGADDGNEFQPLQQRCPLVLRLMKHPAVEFQPGQFPVQVPFGVVQIEPGGCRGVPSPAAAGGLCFDALALGGLFRCVRLVHLASLGLIQGLFLGTGRGCHRDLHDVD